MYRYAMLRTVIPHAQVVTDLGYDCALVMMVGEEEEGGAEEPQNCLPPGESAATGASLADGCITSKEKNSTLLLLYTRNIMYDV